MVCQKTDHSGCNSKKNLKTGKVCKIVISILKQNFSYLLANYLKLFFFIKYAAIKAPIPAKKIKCLFSINKSKRYNIKESPMKKIPIFLK